MKCWIFEDIDRSNLALVRLGLGGLYLSLTTPKSVKHVSLLCALKE